MALSQMSDNDWIRQLAQAGYSDAQIRYLFILRAHYRENVSDGQSYQNNEYGFIRWLIQHGYITEFPGEE